MNTYRNISNELRSYFSGHSIFKILLPIYMIFLFGGLCLLIIDAFTNIGNFLEAIAYYSFLLGLLLAYADFKQRDLYIGMFAYAVIKAYYFLYTIFMFKYVDFKSLISFAIFAGLGYLILKKSATSNT